MIRGARVGGNRGTGFGPAVRDGGMVRRGIHGNGREGRWVRG